MLDPWNHPALWHAINVHLPIALVMLGLPLVAAMAISGAKHRWLRWATAGFYLLATGAAAFAMHTGKAAMAELPNTLPAAAWERINFHQELAEKVWMLTAVCAVLLLLANFNRKWIRQTCTTLALIFSVVTIGWVIVTAHTGGLAVYEQGLGTVAMHQQYDHPTALAAATSPTSSLPNVAWASRPSEPYAESSGETPKPRVSISYKTVIKPLLDNHCSECHEGDEIKGGFDISTVALILKGGKKAGPAIVPGNPDASPLVQYIEGKKQPRMPKNGKPLTPDQIVTVRNWIAAGAVDDTIATQLAAGTAHPAAPSTAPTTAPVTVKVSPDWDPQVQFSASEAVAVRRYVRLKDLLPAPVPPKVTGEAYNPIDQFIVAKWKDAPMGSMGVSPMSDATKIHGRDAHATPSSQPAICDDATFVRRVYLDLIGMIPTEAEARRFVEDKDPKKRDKLVDALLARTRDYAGNWVPFWEDALCSNGQFQGGVGTHGNYRQWLFNAFESNEPYDTMVQELIDPTMPNHPPRYILNDNHDRTVQSAADTAQVFLGTAIKCASCHSHFLNDEWPQARAVAFDGFFTSKDMEVVRCERNTGQFVKTHFMFKLPEAPTTVPSDQKQRLHQVAQLITDPTNPRFAKTMVNRLWKRYMGLGLFEPADDFRLDTPPSHPKLLDWLADDFMRHGFDVKHTIRLILTSRTYQLRYDPALEDHFNVAKPKAMRYFRSPTLRRLTAEELLDSINVALHQQVPETRSYQDNDSTPLTRSLGKPAARNEVSTQRPRDAAIVQLLELLNGKEFHDRVYRGELIDNASIEPKLDQVAEDVYWSVLSRPPTAREKAGTIEFLKSAPAAATTRPVEVVWVDDRVPAHATQAGLWKFAGPPDQPIFSGRFSHTEADPALTQVQHLFTGVSFPVAPTDTLFTYVYIDPHNAPKEIMLQFLGDGAWHRACWGDNMIAFAPKTHLGALPQAGQWVRLEIPAAPIGISKSTTITGISYDQTAGRVYWDKTGADKGPPLHDSQTIGDMIWALMTSPEFQYVK